MIRALGVIAGSLIWLLATSRAGADDTHYRGIPIGAHAIGLGGAFTGVADDVSSAYFNPAGLALTGSVGIAAGLSINAWERIEIDRAFEQQAGVANVTSKTGRTLPIFVGAAFKFGPTMKYDEKRFAIGLSVLEPIFSTSGVFFTFKSDPLQLSNSYRVGRNDRATWYGLSFASKINLKQSLGASLYLSVRKLNHSETGLTLFGGMPIPGDEGTFVGTSSTANTQALSFRAFHFVLRFGWLGRLKPQLQLGVMLQFPGIPLRQTVDEFSQGFFNDNTDPSMPATTEPYFEQGRVNAKLPIPAEIEAGLAYWPAENVMLALDASFHAPVRSDTRVSASGTVPIGGIYFANDTTRLAIGNVAVAGDFSIGKIVRIQTGFFTDLSSAPKIPEDPDRYYEPRIHRLGGTLSVGFNVAGISLAVGSTVLYGKGDAVGARLDVDNFAVDYTRTQSRSRIIYLHLTGATRAATDIGGKAYEGIQRRVEENSKGTDDADAEAQPTEEVQPTEEAPQTEETEQSDEAQQTDERAPGNPDETR